MNIIKTHNRLQLALRIILPITLVLLVFSLKYKNIIIISQILYVICFFIAMWMNGLKKIHYSDTKEK